MSTKKIRTIFDPARQIDRTIEKVITYEASDEARLRQEVREYVATASIEKNFERLLDLLDEGMSGGQREIGVWVSGFYGSGKSSFTKYLGFAFESDRKIDGNSFLKCLQDRFEGVTTRQRLATVAGKHEVAVIMLDLASEMLAGATMADVSTVLNAKVMQWAGYSRDQKVAYFEFLLEKDGRLDEFKERVSALAKGESWDRIKNQPLITKAVASRLASEFYPEYWPDAKAFNDIKIEELIKEDDRVRNMLDLITRKTGRSKVIFILDEVGQYIAARDDLILNLDGLAKNLKAIGKGHVWIISTAQQTLTEDDPRAVTNSAKLFKLKDRFPVTIDLEASDIKEICYRRLLSKCGDGDTLLKQLFERHGPQLKLATELKNTRYYKADLDANWFCRLYPFLPQHFDILLELIARLARSSGGIGLRSAIKVVQDVLVDQSRLRPGASLLANASLGTLATTVDFYDTLQKDIERSFRHIVEGIEKVKRAFGEDSFEARTAKTVAVLQLLEDFPVTRENVAALMHPAVDSASLVDQVNAAVDRMLGERSLSLNEVDGRLRFMSEAVKSLEDERLKINPRVADSRNIYNTALRDILTPAPTVRLMGTRSVSTGYKVYAGSMPLSLEGEKEEIQTHVVFVPESGYAAKRTELIQESTQKTSGNVVFLIGHEDKELDAKILEIFRCRTIYSQKRNAAADKEVEEYLRAQSQRADKLTEELQQQLRKGLTAGSFIFRGKPKAVTELADTLTDASPKFLESVASDVFDKYSEAPLQAESALTERFLNTERLDRIATKDDPLSLVKRKGGIVSIDRDHKALVSIRDYLEQRGQVDGRRLLDDFFAAPYGWSKDTTRYLVAAMLVGGMIKLRVAGQDITVRGETAIAFLKNTNNFNKIGVALRDGQIPPELKMKAAERLLELTGEQVLPLEEDISRAVMKHFPDFQQQYAPLETQITNLGLQGADRAQSIQDSVAEILKGDASDAANRLGGEECPLVEDLRWACEVLKAFQNGIGSTIRKATELIREIPLLPKAGAFAEVVRETEEDRQQLADYIQRPDFHRHKTDMQAKVTAIECIIALKAAGVLQEQARYFDVEKGKILNSPEWNELGQDDRVRLAGELDVLRVDASQDLAGLKQLVTNRYALDAELQRVRAEIQALLAGGGAENVMEKDLTGLPRVITAAGQLDSIIEELEKVKELLNQKTCEKVILKWT